MTVATQENTTSTEPKATPHLAAMSEQVAAAKRELDEYASAITADLSEIEAAPPSIAQVAEHNTELEEQAKHDQRQLHRLGFDRSDDVGAKQKAVRQGIADRKKRVWRYDPQVRRQYILQRADKLEARGQRRLAELQDLRAPYRVLKVKRDPSAQGLLLMWLDSRIKSQGYVDGKLKDWRLELPGLVPEAVVRKSRQLTTLLAWLTSAPASIAGEFTARVKTARAELKRVEDARRSASWKELEAEASK